jgi:hypothetical protein|nr:MAG TPA: cell wall hydrolase [Caudoviricetes sp.]
MNIQEWINTVNGKTIDVDRAYGGQCWDLWSHYAQHVYGIPQADTNTVDGYAASVYTARYGRSRALQNTFERKPANYTPVYGDVAFWKCSRMNHVAIVVRDNGNGTLQTISQNPNRAGYVNIGKKGIIGYFHPRNSSNNTTTTTTRAYRVNVDVLNVRSAPSIHSQVVAQYRKGQTVNLMSGTTIADGYVWGHYVGGSGKTRYVALKAVNGTNKYLV